MTKLDIQIADLFMQMIKSSDKITNIRNGTIEFENGLSISMYAKNSKKDKNRENQPLGLKTYYNNSLIWFWELIELDTDKILFSINTPYRSYEVPEHERHTYVKILDTLEGTIHGFEKRKLKEYQEYFK